MGKTKKNDKNDILHSETEEYYLERRLFGDDYVEGIYDETLGEHEREERNRGLRSVLECCDHSNGEVQGVLQSECKQRVDSPWRGNGPNPRTICPKCGKDMQNSYCRKTVYGVRTWIVTGLQCSCGYHINDAEGLKQLSD